MRSMRANAFLLMRFFFVSSNCGRKMSEKKVVPTMAKAANKPKSFSRSVLTKIRPMNEPMVVRQPRKTGLVSSRSTCSGSVMYL